MVTVESVIHPENGQKEKKVKGKSSKHKRKEALQYRNSSPPSSDDKHSYAAKILQKKKLAKKNELNTEKTIENNEEVIYF